MYVSLKRTIGALRLVATTRTWIDDYEQEKKSNIFSGLRPKLDGVDDPLVQVAIAISGKRTFVVIRKALSICGYYQTCITNQLQALEHQMIGSLEWALTRAWGAELEVMSEIITKTLSEKEAHEIHTKVVNLREKVEAIWPVDIPMPSRKPVAAA
jgi:hypothetical protein